MSCSHPGLRTFTFADGKTIQCCPDCDAFDSKRHDVLGTNPPKYGGQMEHYISGAPSLHRSEIIEENHPTKFSAPVRTEQQYNNDPRIIQAFRFRPVVLNTIYKKVRPHAEHTTRAQAWAEELTNDVWTKVIEDIATFNHKSSLKTWLVSIALHTASDWIDRLHAKKRAGEVLSDFVAENEDGECEGDAYPDAKQDQLVGLGSGERRKFVYRDALSFTATERVMEINAAAENGAYVSPVERRILRDWICANLRDIQLHHLHSLLPRKASKIQVPEPTEMKNGQKWSPLKGWAPPNREFFCEVELDFYQQLRKRKDRRTHCIAGKSD